MSIKFFHRSKFFLSMVFALISITIITIYTYSRKALLLTTRPVVHTIAFSPDGRKVAIGGGRMVPHGAETGGYVWIWPFDAESNSKNYFQHLGHNVHWIAYSPTGENIATWEFPSQSYKLWNEASGQLLHEESIERPAVVPIALAKGWLSAVEMKALEHRLSNLIRLTEKNKGLVPVAVSKDRKYGAFLTGNNFLQIWSLNSLKLIKTVTSISAGTTPQATAFSPDNKFIAFGTRSSGQASYEIWEIKHARLKRVLKTRSSRCHLLVFSADSRKVVTEDFEGLIEIWDCNSGAVLANKRVD